MNGIQKTAVRTMPAADPPKGRSGEWWWKVGAGGDVHKAHGASYNFDLKRAVCCAETADDDGGGPTE